MKTRKRRKHYSDADQSSDSVPAKKRVCVSVGPKRRHGSKGTESVAPGSNLCDGCSSEVQVCPGPSAEGYNEGSSQIPEPGSSGNKSVPVTSRPKKHGIAATKDRARKKPPTPKMKFRIVVSLASILNILLKFVAF